MPESLDFLALAKDVGDSIAALAEPAGGGSRWQTQSYAGEPQYSTDVFAGTAGIPIFLADLFGATGETRYREIAESGAMWLDAQTRSKLASADRDPGLYFGIAGHGMVFLHLSQATRRQRWLDLALARARALRSVCYDGSDALWGAAGVGIFLLRTYQATGDNAWLDSARGAAGYLLEVARQDGEGARWAFQRRSGTFWPTGFAHGSAGIGVFLAELARFTNDGALEATVAGAVRWIEAQATESEHGIAWTRWPGDNQPPRVQWCYGAPGIGLFASRAFEATGDGRFKDLALRCGEATYRAGDVRENPSQCHGLAGNAELFIELARALGDETWLARAREFGALAAAYREESDGQVRWRGDEPGNYSPDFMLGAAGIGHFFLRLARPEAVSLPLLPLPASQASDTGG